MASKRKRPSKRVIAALRRAHTMAATKYSIGGRLKRRPRVSVTLPKLKSEPETV